MSSYAYTPSSTYGSTRSTVTQGDGSLLADAAAPVTGSAAAVESGLQAGWSSTGWNQPLFWLLIIVLLWFGYVYFGFNLGFKGGGKIKGGKVAAQI